MDLGQETLFGQKTIKTISFDEQEIIKDILYLHSPNNRIDLDPCYSIGEFYNHGLEQPEYKFDKTPQTEDTAQAESDNLPLDSGSINTIMFDPPFVISGQPNGNDKEGSSIITTRFTGFRSWDHLKEMYSGSLNEFHRLLKEDGIVIFKCQDTVSSGKNHFTHCWVMQKALEIGFYPKDLFVLLSKNRVMDGRKQQHARKFHCYYWVFQKKNAELITNK